MAVVATAPLTQEERWRKAEPGSLWVFTKGELLETFEPPLNYRAPSSVAPPWQPG